MKKLFVAMMKTAIVTLISTIFIGCRTSGTSTLVAASATHLEFESSEFEILVQGELGGPATLTVNATVTKEGRRPGTQVNRIMGLYGGCSLIKTSSMQLALAECTPGATLGDIDANGMLHLGPGVKLLYSVDYPSSGEVRSELRIIAELPMTRGQVVGFARPPRLQIRTQEIVDGAGKMSLIIRQVSLYASLGHMVGLDCEDTIDSITVNGRAITIRRGADLERALVEIRDASFPTEFDLTANAPVVPVNVVFAVTRANSGFKAALAGTIQRTNVFDPLDGATMYVFYRTTIQNEPTFKRCVESPRQPPTPNHDS